MCWADLRMEKGMRRPESTAQLFHIVFQQCTLKTADLEKSMYVTLLTKIKELTRCNLNKEKFVLSMNFTGVGAIERVGTGGWGFTAGTAGAGCIVCYSSIDRKQRGHPALKPVPRNQLFPAVCHLFHFPQSHQLGTKRLGIWACGEHCISGSLICARVFSLILTQIHMYIHIYIYIYMHILI